MKVIFNNVGDVEDFVARCESLKCDVNVSKGNHSVDGKSLVGILWLGIGSAMDVKILTDNKRDVEILQMVAGKYAMNDEKSMD